MNLDEEYLLQNTARLSVAAEHFLETELGKYLLAKADNEAETALIKLKTASPIMPEMIRELQNEIWRAESIKQWIFDAISEGQWAREELENR